jgi:hypothetical protein
MVGAVEWTLFRDIRLELILESPGSKKTSRGEEAKVKTPRYHQS